VSIVAFSFLQQLVWMLLSVHRAQLKFWNPMIKMAGKEEAETKSRN